MKFLEKDLEDIIYESCKTIHGRESLVCRGLDSIDGISYFSRQVRVGNYGIADLVTLIRFEKTIYVNIYELKKDVVNIDTLIQCSRYAKGIKGYMNSRFRGCRVHVHCTLIGRYIDENSDWVYLFNSVIENTTIYTYKYGIDGLNFELHNMNYSLTNEGFNV